MYANGVSSKLSGRVEKKKRMSDGDMTRREIREIRSKGWVDRLVGVVGSPHSHSVACLSLCPFFASHCFLCCLNLSGSKPGSSLMDRPRMVSLRRPDDLIFLTVFGLLGSLAASLRSPRDFSFLISRAIFSRVDPFEPLGCVFWDGGAECFVEFLELLEELPLVEGRSEEVKLIPESTFRPLRWPASVASSKCWHPVTSEHSLMMLFAKLR